MADIGYALLLIGGFAVLLLALRGCSGCDQPERHRVERLVMDWQLLWPFPPRQRHGREPGRGQGHPRARPR
jgi:hypothetical protein